jgi:integrase
MTSLWRKVVGLAPHVVTAEERPAKGHRVYLRWWDARSSNWRARSLGIILRDLKGRAYDAAEQRILKEAERQYELLAGKRAAESPARGPLTLGETWTLVSDRQRGLYPHATAHRREVERALRDACRLLGSAMPWTLMDRAAFRALGRQRLDEVRDRRKQGGLRAGEIIVARLLAVGAWLRAEAHIPDHAGFAEEHWKEKMHEYASGLPGGIAAPHRPRHTTDEMRRVLASAWEVDPRAGLLLALGAELRLGQVARARRSDLDLVKGLFRSPGRGKKRGVLVELTRGQLAAVTRALTGYLASLEGTAADYALFPQGKLVGGRCASKHATRPSIERTAWRKWFEKAEAKADIPHVAGRGAYGIRRQAVDFTKAAGASREALQAMGGWADSQVPDRIYAEQEQLYAAKEAAEVRAKLRGEGDTVPLTYPSTETAPSGRDTTNGDR